MCNLYAHVCIIYAMSFITTTHINGDKEVPLYLAYTTVEDPFYRYTVRKLLVRVKNTGKMRRTFFENLDAVSERLNVPPTIIAPFFAYALSVAYISPKKGEYPAISGCFTVKELDDVFKRFLRSVTLCSRCRLLETDIHVRKSRDTVVLNCQACGHRTDLRDIDEIPDRYIRALLKSNTAMPRRTISKKRRTRFHSKKIEHTDVVWFTDTSDRAVEQRLEKSSSSVIDTLLE